MLEMDNQVCELCEGGEFRVVAVEAGHSIVKCRDCGLVQVRPLPKEQETGNTAYWHTDLDDTSVHRSRLGSKGVYEHGLKRVQALCGYTLTDKKVLDVGCGMGVFLEVVKDAGGIPFGLDLSPDALEYTRRHTGIESLTLGTFEAAELPDAPFDMITGWNVLEHVRHPRVWLNKAHDLLSPGGVIVIKVPNVCFSGLIARHATILRKLGLPTTNYLATRPPLHLYGFSPQTLQRMLEATGFEVLSEERSLVRESKELKGRVVTSMAMLVQVLTLGRVNLHPLIMGMAVKR